MGNPSVLPRLQQRGFLMRKRWFSCRLYPVSDREMRRQGAWEAGGSVCDPHIALVEGLSL